ncbi:acyltransferase family protein [Brevundimonas pondensis]|uniref:Acyltransferase n=1 Tax=Brevundimonas pondensis TaxID=2774189 RepID=A0ABX7SJ50_9CAUL|nr:acyltransferase [Brevundimonas pondensis]QTC87171.1 acyltransferase [Brevundimonas pondensis]
MTLTSAAPPAASKMRGGALDALRFVAALFVVVFHFGDTAPISLQSMHGFLGRGYLATDFFLILSGFVLAKAYGAGVASGKVSLGRFWLKRFARCYPTHVITLAILVVMVLTAGALGMQATNAGRFDLAGLPAQIFLLHAFGLGGGHWNIPSWTISTLLICYAFFPMLWRAMLRLNSVWISLGLAIAIIVGSNALSLALLGEQQFSLPFQWCMFRAAPLFLVGLALARAVQTGRWTDKSARIVGFGGGAVLLANAFMVGPDLINVLAICAIIIGCGASPVTRPIPGAEWGAKVSFCLFMVHTITGAVWFDVVEPLAARLHPAVESVAWEAWAMWFGALVFTLIASDLYNRFIDEPIQKWIGRKWFARPVSSRPDPRPAAEQSA